MKKRMLAFFLALVMAFGLLSGCGSKPAANGGDGNGAEDLSGISERTIQIGHVSGVAESDKYQKFATLFADKVATYSDGKIKIEIVGSSGLGGERDMLEGMSLGTIDMAILTNSTLCQFIEEFMILELPYLFSDRYAANEFFTNSDLLDDLDAQLKEQNNCVVLSCGECGLRHSVNNDHPYNTVSDLRGVKMRTMESEMPLAIFQAFGANPTPMAWSDCFTAVQQGALDAVEIPINFIYSDGYYEICKYISLTGHQYATSLMCMSTYLWDELNDAEKEIFSKAATEAAQEQIAFLDACEADMLQSMKDYGCEVNTPDLESFKAAAETVYEHYRDYFGAEVFDPIVNAAKAISE